MVNNPVVEVRHDSAAGFRWGPLLLVALGLTVSLIGVVGAVLTRQAKPVVSLMFATLALAMVVLLAGSVAAALPRRSHHLRVRQVPEGLEVVGSPWPQRSGVLAALLMIAGAVVAVVTFSSGLDVLTPTVLLLLCAPASGWAALRYLTGRRPVDRVMVGRHGFTSRIRGRETEMSWGDVSGFAVSKMGLVVDVHAPNETDGPAAVIPIAELRSDPTLVADLLEFYRDHVRLRSELMSDAVLDRLRQGTFRSTAS